MKEEKGITLVALAITIIILIILAGISVNTLIGETGIITKAKEAKQNILLARESEALQLNQLYYELETVGSIGGDDEADNNDAIILELQKEIEDLKDLLSKTNATEDKILKDYIAYSKGQLMMGTMEDNGILDGNLNCGESYVIPKGYTDGGTIIANSLESQTSATATAADILSGKTAWVNGIKITGTGSSIDLSKLNNIYANRSFGTTTYTTTQDCLFIIFGVEASNTYEKPTYSAPGCTVLLDTRYTVYLCYAYSYSYIICS